MNRKAIALVVSFIVITSLAVLGTAMLSKSISESRLAKGYSESIQSFWLAEAGVNRALVELRSNYNATGNNQWTTSLGSGGYSVDVVVNGQSRTVTVRGFVPFTGTARVERRLDIVMNKHIPLGFYDKAIYSGGDIDINGDSFSVTGDTIYADDLDVQHPENIVDENGDPNPPDQDASISPLARLDFQQLLTISQGQGNVYDDARLQDVKTGADNFPVTFWYSDPTDPTDSTTGVPNVVYVTTDLHLNGNIGAIGGFFVVVGDVINTPDETQQAVVNGNGTIEGCIYTRGTFRINGGGGNLNVNGGVWAGDEARLNGNAHIAYNADYMAALGAMSINAEVQIISWRDPQNPYVIVP